ncbi:MAG: CinA family protein [Chlamydiia bacterium]
MSPDPLDRVRKILYWLEQHQKTLAVAESVTGGRISSFITSIDGASKVYRGGVCTYQDGSKESLLEVPSSLLAQQSAVSEGVARAMARGAQKIFSSDVALSTTGYAGPTGPDGEVGLLWCAVCVAKREQTFTAKLQGTRMERQAAFSELALKWLWEALLHVD